MMVDTTPKPFVFVLMPFESKYDDIYKLGIKQACENAGAYAERVDEQFYEGSITQRIYNQIDKADIIVADMTGKNPNVFYEVGYAHALGKYVIPLTQDTNDIPFDFKAYPHIVYGGKIAEKLLPDLEKNIRWAIEHKEEKSDRLKFPIEVYYDGNLLLNKPEVKLQTGKEGKISFFHLVFDLHNSDQEILKVIKFQVAFITSNRIKSCRYSSRVYSNVIVLPENKNIHILKIDFTILPGSWEKLDLIFRTSPGKDMFFSPKDTERVVFRVISEYGGYDYPFSVKFV